MVRKILFLLLLSKSSLAQEHLFMEPDEEPNCLMIQTGKFHSVIYNEDEYYLVANKDTVHEYVSEGRYYIKTKRDFVNNCAYKSTILEVTIPDYDLKPGDTIYTEILETECEFVKVKVTMGDKEVTTVLIKESED